MAAATIVLHVSTRGWFTYYCFTLPARHPGVDGSFVNFWWRDMIRPFGLAGLLSAFAIVERLRSGASVDRLFVPVLAAALTVASWSVRSRLGAEVNNLIPAYAGLAALAAMGLHDVERQAAIGGGPWNQGTALVGAALMLLQLIRLVYDPRTAIPTAADARAGERIVARIAEIPGDVFAPHHGYLAVMAGKRAGAHTLAMDNVFLDDEGRLSRELSREMDQALDAQRFGAALLEVDRRYEDPIVRNYPKCERLFDRSDTFIPVAGAPLRPEFLCRP
jgi:hypothetical protein